ncbi:ferredoxin reductase [Chitinimonas arctica]|nr:ferredoxin reductase [Chitinimonas arctica]
MPLLPAALVNRLLPQLRPLRRGALASLVREDIFDFYGRLLHPQLQLHRVFARVLSCREEGDSSLVLTLAPSANWRGMQPGQHVALTVDIDGIRHTRRYSPSVLPGGQVEITVKRQEGGLVSGWLHEQAKPGDYLELGQAEGDFVLPATPPAKLLLLAAGSGITPLLAMLRALRAQAYQGDVVMLYYGRRRANLAHLTDLASFPGLRLHICLTGEAPGDGESSGRFSAAQLDELVPDAAERRAYACGAHGFVASVRAVWQARALPALADEAFTPPVWQAADDLPITLTFARSVGQLPGRTGSTLLEQAEALGLRPAFGCRMGICNTCSCHKRTGAVRDLRTGLVSTEPDEAIRLCISAPVGDVILDL